ncbi:DUF2065 family protein [Candidatus Pacearchaeota archaeon]|nr:DUF2065 family protein [Candidatus Pacearchaeota archaeon]MBD3283724.1 DUF2065 family protein [Candidatus Pacearchaeota archaeon]
MHLITVIFATIGIVLFIEGCFIAIFTREIKKFMKELSKQKSNLKIIGLLELIFGFIIFQKKPKDL